MRTMHYTVFGGPDGFLIYADTKKPPVAGPYKTRRKANGVRDEMEASRQTRGWFELITARPTKRKPTAK